MPDNLRKEAEARGVAPERLIFAPMLPTDLHLARLPLADLFLDGLPYNAHTTGSDALWAGVPLITQTRHDLSGPRRRQPAERRGPARTGDRKRGGFRGAGGQAGARMPAALEKLRDKLAKNTGNCALFDTAAFTATSKRPMRRCGKRWLAGEKPKATVGFAVIASPAPL